MFINDTAVAQIKTSFRLISPALINDTISLRMAAALEAKIDAAQPAPRSSDLSPDVS